MQSHELSEECNRRFNEYNGTVKELEKRVRDLERFQTISITIVVVANFIWVYFVNPLMKKGLGL